MDNQEARQYLQTLTTRISESELLAVRGNQDTEQDRKIISFIFHKLQAICPAWQQSLAGMAQGEKEQLLKTIKREWLNSLMSAGINDQRTIDYALNRVKEEGSPFLPTIGVFLRYCEEGSLPAGIKTPEQSYKEVCEYQCLPREKRQPSGLSPEVWHTLGNLNDLHSWRHMAETKHKQYWLDEYKRTVKRLKDGRPLDEAPPPRKAIENKPTPTNRVDAISRLKAMRDQL